MRDECLNTSWFRTLNEIREKPAGWQQEYNCERPHTSLDYRTPQEFKRACDEITAMGPDLIANPKQQRKRENSSYGWLRNRGQVRKNSPVRYKHYDNARNCYPRAEEEGFI